MKWTQRYTLSLAGLIIAVGCVAGFLAGGCASPPPPRANIEIQLLGNGNFHFMGPGKERPVTLAGLPSALKAHGARPETSIRIRTPENTPKAMEKEIIRVLRAKGYLRVLFEGSRKFTAEVLPKKTP